MGNRRIGLNTTITGLTGFMIIRWVKASTPLVEAGRKPATTFPVNQVDTLLNLDPVVYTVQWWRSNDGVSLDQLIKDWSINAAIYNIASVITYQYKVDRGWDNTTPVVTDGVWADPVNLDVTLNDTRLDGFAKTEMLVHEAGFGDKLDAEYDLVAGGGIELLGGATFNTDTAWFITVSNVVEVNDPSGGGSSGGLFEGVVIVDADQDFDDVTDPLANKLVIADWGADSVGTITFPDLALISDGTHVTFSTHGGLQNYLKLQFDAGQTVRFLNQLVNVIYLAKCEKISLYFSTGACYVIDYDGRALQRGGVSADYDSNRAANSLAYLLADESTGELLKSEYPGLYEWVEGLSSGVVPLGTSVGQWEYDSGGGVYPNKRYYGLRTTGTPAFRVPHLTGMTAKFAAVAGVYEADNVGSFSGNITLPKGYSYTGGPNVARMGNGASSPANVDHPFTYTAAIPETRVKSFAQIPYIIL